MCLTRSNNCRGNGSPVSFAASAAFSVTSSTPIVMWPISWPSSV
jgi:hypothetical protein